MRTLVLILLFFPLLLMAQPGNYWTNSFNSEASLLSGAVVGSNAGITAIFYNPAGISNVKKSRFDLNASLFNLEYKRYNNPLGENTLMENWAFRVFPRFASYLFQFDFIESVATSLSNFLGFDTTTLISTLIFLIAGLGFFAILSAVGGLGTYAERKISEESDSPLMT